MRRYPPYRNLYSSSQIMRTPRLTKSLNPLLVLTAGLLLLSTGPGPAQTFMSLHGFTALDSSFENTDGAYSAAGLVLLGNSLYGTASQGGTAGRGTVFKVNTDGTSFFVLHSFSVSDPNSGTNGDGAFPLGGLVWAGNNVYGTTSAGGGAANGTVFKMNLDGSSFATLHSFTASDPNTGANSDGTSPWCGLILSGNTLYGTATRGGDSGSGTVFKLNPTTGASS